MPKVAEFYGIVIAIYSADHNPPHVHVKYAEHEASVEIQTGAVLIGSVPGPQLRRALEWIARNRAALLQEWAVRNPNP
jgi:hypothetical protein